MSDEMIQFDCKPIGNNGQVRLTARLGEMTLGMDKVDLSSASARKRFAKSVCKDRPGIDRAEVEAELMKLAASTEDARQEPAKDSGLPQEVDVSRIVRPEQFITPEVSGLTVAVNMDLGDRPVPRWVLYLRWADGRREAIELPESLMLPDGKRLWIHPMPGEPSVPEAPAWSMEARQAWLGGADAPGPAEVFHRVRARIEYFLDFPKDRTEKMTSTLALWAMLTYVFQAWNAVPYLYFGGAAGSGKSRAFEVLDRVVFRPLISSNMTGPALFRTLHSHGGTLLLDEAEHLKQPGPEVEGLRSMLLAGYKRGGQATRLELVGDVYKETKFDVYGPKGLACIQGLPGPLLSRCITMRMFRASKNSPKPRRRIDADPGAWQALRADLHALALEYGEEFRHFAGRDDVCPSMFGRQHQLWQPLLALAAWIESHGEEGLLSLMQDHAREVNASAENEVPPDCDEVLLRAVALLIKEGQSPMPKDVLARAMELEPGTFDRWSPKGVASHLSGFGVVTRKTVGDRRYADVTPDQLLEIQRRYGLELGLEDPGEDDDAGEAPGDVPQVPQVPRDDSTPGSEQGTWGMWGTFNEGRSAQAEALVPGDLPEDLREAYEERAAIKECSGGMPRADAEREAWAEIVDRKETETR